MCQRLNPSLSVEEAHQMANCRDEKNEDEEMKIEVCKGGNRP